MLTSFYSVSDSIWHFKVMVSEWLLEWTTCELVLIKVRSLSKSRFGHLNYSFTPWLESSDTHDPDEDCTYRCMDFITSSAVTLFLCFCENNCCDRFKRLYQRGTHTVGLYVLSPHRAVRVRRGLLEMRSQMKNITQASDDFTQSYSRLWYSALHHIPPC